MTLLITWWRRLASTDPALAAARRDREAANCRLRDALDGLTDALAASTTSTATTEGDRDRPA